MKISPNIARTAWKLGESCSTNNAGTNVMIDIIVSENQSSMIRPVPRYTAFAKLGLNANIVAPSTIRWFTGPPASGRLTYDTTMTIRL